MVLANGYDVMNSVVVISTVGEIMMNSASQIAMLLLKFPS